MMDMRVRRIWMGISIAVFFFAAVALFSLFGTTTSSVALGGKEFRVEVADTNATRERGLSGRVGLAEGKGMLFVFDHADTYGFWMKDMKFPIDILWIHTGIGTDTGSGGRVVHIEKSVSPSTYPTVFYPPTSAQYVLEISAGETEKLNAKVGDFVQFSHK